MRVLILATAMAFATIPMAYSQAPGNVGDANQQNQTGIGLNKNLRMGAGALTPKGIGRGTVGTGLNTPGYGKATPGYGSATTGLAPPVDCNANPKPLSWRCK